MTSLHGERARNTSAASELGPVHGHDPQVDKLAAVPLSSTAACAGAPRRELLSVGRPYIQRGAPISKNTKEADNLKAILYCRVDGPENPFAMDALRGQKEALIAYAQAHGMELEWIQMDIGWMPGSLESCGLRSVIEAVRGGSADVILVADRSLLYDGPMPPELEGLPIIALNEREPRVERETTHEL